MLIKEADPKGLIRESYNIEGIKLAECKTIFFDWAIQVPVSEDPCEHIKFCLSYYGTSAPEHPMTSVLKLALNPAPYKKRRGGRAGRITPEGRRRDGLSE